MKISQELSDRIYNLYSGLKSEGKYKKGFIQQMLMEEFDLPKTSCWDHSRGREKGVVVVQAKEEAKIEPPVVLAMPSGDYKLIGNEKTFIITGWEIRNGIDYNFLDCLNQLATHFNAKKLLVPVWPTDIDYLPQILKDNFEIVTHNIRFNNSLQMHYCPTHALALSPLSSWEGIFHGETTILPGLISEMISEPSVKHCKRLLTTGSVGYLNASFDQFSFTDDDSYKALKKRWESVTNRAAGKSTALAQRLIKPTALVIHILDDNLFLTRYVTMAEDGVLYDLDRKFVAGKEEPEPSNPLALICGDYHVWNMEFTSHVSTVNQISTLSPKYVVLNDFSDQAASNYHLSNNIVDFNKLPSIDEEAEVTKKTLKEICDISNKVIYLQSNHDNFLLKILSMPESIQRLNRNYPTLCELQAYRLKEDKHPVIKLLDLDSIDNLQFIDEKDFFVLKETTIIHGHNSFRPTSFRGLAKLYGKLITGHFHRPEIRRGMAFCVGSNAKKDLDYSIGINASMPTNAIMHPDGTVQLIDTIKGMWRIPS